MRTRAIEAESSYIISVHRLGRNDIYPSGKNVEAAGRVSSFIVWLFPKIVC
jgi:hypothetical protein